MVGTERGQVESSIMMLIRSLRSVARLGQCMALALVLRWLKKHYQVGRHGKLWHVQSNAQVCLGPISGAQGGHGGVGDIKHKIIQKHGVFRVRGQELGLLRMLVVLSILRQLGMLGGAIR